ncbi:hypothetical protein BGX33_010251 [Mortierella sp. NVP41]|nr:hypothetical protein BGX33_010251 [Mortierella sp. NVP41]
MQLLFFKSQLSRKKQLPHQKPHALRTPFPLNAPDVLAHVFSYLDENTLRKIAILVCRRWFELNLDRVYQRELAWDWAWGPNKLEKTLSKRFGATRLYCYGSDYGDEGNAFSTGPILKTIVNLQARHNQLMRLNGSAISMFRPLRELELNNILLPVDMTSHFRLPSTLTSLKIIAGAYSACRIRVDYILGECPLLEVLHFCKAGVLVVDDPWVPANHNRQQPFRLQSLVIKNAKIQQSSLEDLLTLTPELQELKLISLAKREGQLPYSHVAQPGDAQYDWTHLFEHLKGLSITLRALQFSVHSQSHPNRIQAMEESSVRQKTIDACPHAFEWSLLPAEITPGIIQELVSLPNIITTLEIVTEGAWCHRVNNTDARVNKSGLNLIHQYLCESPHLVHLKVIRAAILFEDLDINNRARYEDLGLGGDRMWGNSEMGYVMPRKQSVWACCRLETLQVQIHAHESEMIWPVHSRIVFGYIATVCPMLQELSIFVPSYCSHHWGEQVYQPRMYFQLDGGLCLLSKLDHLRKLKVIYGDEESRNIGCQEYELNWITRSGYRAKDKARRAVTMANWESQLEAERTLERRFLNSRRPSLIVGQEEPADQLRNLGLLSEVKKMVEEMDGSDRRWLPMLERVSFHDSIIERRPEVALRMMFPRLIDLLR